MNLLWIVIPGVCLALAAGGLFLAGGRGARGLLLFWDKGKRSLDLALRSLWLHKLRAFLSVLGIIIGTAAVIALMAFGEGSMQDALDDIKRQGATNVIIRSVKPPEGSGSQGMSRVSLYGLTYKDYDRFQLIPGIEEHVPMRIFPQEIRRYAYLHNGRVVGTTARYSEIAQFQVLDGGRFLHAKDEREMADVCVIGSAVAEALFPFEDPHGKTIVIRSHDYKVIGVIDERVAVGGGGGNAEDFNSDVYIPLSTCRGRFGEKITIRASGSFIREQVELHQVVLKIQDMDKVRDVGALVRDQLGGTHLKKDWSVTVPLDRLEEAERARDRGTLLLAMIAAISLLVGGIGIMNIMLATVTERTREIGIRRALGAKRRDITLQFLIEAIVQTSLGGMMGVLLGLGMVFGLPVLYEWLTTNPLPAKLHVPAIFISVGASIFVGVVFGLYPAWKASRLDPIEALRHE